MKRPRIETLYKLRTKDVKPYVIPGQTVIRIGSSRYRCEECQVGAFKRLQLICPTCGKRVFTLLAREASGAYICSKCMRPIYPCQRMTDHDRLRLKARRLREKYGFPIEGDLIPSCLTVPKWRHGAVHFRHLDEVHELEMKAFLIIAEQAARLFKIPYLNAANKQF